MTDKSMMKLFLSVFLFMHFSLYAQDVCNDEKIPVIQEQAIDLLEPLFHAATDEQVETSRCRNQFVPDADQVYLMAESGQLPVSRSVNGVNFENEDPYLIELFEKLTTRTDGIGYVDNKNKNDLSKFKIDPNCRKVRCAMEAIWDEGQGPKLLYLLDQFDLNGSELRNSSILEWESYRRMSPEELDSIIKSVHDMPRDQFPLSDRTQPISHVDSKTIQAQSTIANAVITLFDLWNKQSESHRQYTVFHEMAHNLSSKLGDIDSSPEWLELSGWEDSGKRDMFDRPEFTQNEERQGHMCSVYSMTNPAEDFAESVSAYRYNPKALKDRDPKKYEFIKEKVYKGREFNNKNQCASVKLNDLIDIKKDVIKNLTADIPIDDIKNSCKGKLSLDSDNTVFENCILNLMNIAIKKKVEQENFSGELKKYGYADTKFLQGEIKQSILLDKSLKYRAKELSLNKSEDIKTDQLLAIKENEQALKTKAIEKVEIDKFSREISKSCSEEIIQAMSNDISYDKCVASYIGEKRVEKNSSFELLDKKSAKSVNEKLRKASYEAILAKDAKEYLQKEYISKSQVILTNGALKMEFKLNWEDKKSVWRKLSSEDFCNKYYSKNTGINFNLYINQINDNQENQALAGTELYKTCMEIQNGEKKRFALTKEVLDNHFSKN